MAFNYLCTRKGCLAEMLVHQRDVVVDYIFFYYNIFILKKNWSQMLLHRIIFVLLTYLANSANNCL
jgi:hypothetical protein